MFSYSAPFACQIKRSSAQPSDNSAARWIFEYSFYHATLEHPATAKRRLTERIIPKAYRENFPPHTHGDEFKETPGNPLGEGEKSLWKKITRYDNRSFLHQGRSLTAASEKITQGPPTHNLVSWGTPLFVTYDELHSPNHSSFHILMFTTRGQSEPQQYIQSPSFTMTEGTAAWKAIRQTRRHLKMERARMSPTKI